MKDAALRDYLSQQNFDFDTAIAMIKKGANRDTLNSDGHSLLHLLVYTKAYSLIPVVLRRKGNIDTINSFGHTALHCLLMQHPVNFESVFLLMKAGAQITQEDERSLYCVDFFIDVMNLYLAIKQCPYVKKNDTEKRLLPILLQQNPINVDAVALLVFAGAGLLKKGEPVPNAIKSKHMIDNVTGGVLSTPFIAPKTLHTLGRGDKTKERVIEYIESLPIDMQKALIPQTRGDTPLGRFFGVRRGLFGCDKSSGTWGELGDMQKKLAPVSSYTPVRIVPSSASSSAHVPLSADETRPSAYNPSLFGKSRAYIEHQKLYVFGPGSPPP